MNNIKPVKKSHNVIAWTAFIVCLLTFSLYTFLKVTTTKNEMLIDDLDIRITTLQQAQDKMWDELDVVRSNGETVAYKKDVLFSNYGEWDMESVDTTASGLTSNDFIVNEYGMYIYDGRVVVASANISRWDVPLKKDYVAYELGDYLTLELFGNSFPAIVLDVCYECHGNDRENIQRLDIFTTSNVVGLTEGKVYKNEK